MEQPSPAPISGRLYWLAVLAAWSWLFRRISEETWEHGRETFLRLALIVLLTLCAGWLGRRIAALPSPRSRWLEVVLRALAAGATLYLLVQMTHALTGELRFDPYGNRAVDIGINTAIAEDWFAAGENPYAQQAQLQYKFEPGPNVEVRDSNVFMYGVPYKYGYPYYPMMFLSYLPFRLVVPGAHSVRLGNWVFLVLNLVGFLLLSRRLAPRSSALTAAAFASVLFLGVPMFVVESVQAAVADVVISTFALFAYVALSSGRMTLAGVLFGLAAACKLLPGPMLVLPALIWAWGRPGFARLLTAFLVSSLMVLLPFILADPSAFLSSTVLFYLVNHAQGDTTSAWYYLPESARPAFTAVGYLLCLGALGWTVRLRRGDVLWPMTIAFAAYLIFVAFARMTHLNYIWGVYSLGSAAIVLQSLRGTDGEPA